MTEKEYNEKKKEFELKTKWLRDSLMTNEIQFNFEHNTCLSSLYNDEDKESFIYHFFELFTYPIMLLSDIELEKLKKGEICIKGGISTCSVCGERFSYEFNGKGIRAVKILSKDGINEPVKCNKLKDTYTFEIEFPTGEIICKDRLPYYSEILGHLDKTEHSLNSDRGIYERTLSLSTQNILQVYTGNSNPSLWKNEDVLAIGCIYEDECDRTVEEKLPIGNSKELTMIVTNFWWGSIVDVEIYKKLLISHFGEEVGISKIKEIEKVPTLIKKGIYKCTYYTDSAQDEYGEKKFEEEEPLIYCKLEWVRDCINNHNA